MSAFFEVVLHVVAAWCILYLLIKIVHVRLSFGLPLKFLYNMSIFYT